MGTNEVANVAVGSNVGLDDRIDVVMKAVGTARCMWLTIKTQRTSGPYKQSGSEKWTEALAKACTRYPNMRVYDWAAEVKDAWFIDDGIHFRTKGYRERGKRTARALATPSRRTASPRPDCMIRTA